MTDNIVTEISRKPVDDIIDLLEEALERAKAGESVGIGIIEVRVGRTVATALSYTDCYHLLMSGAARLAHRLAAQEDE